MHIDLFDYYWYSKKEYSVGGISVIQNAEPSYLGLGPARQNIRRYHSCHRQRAHS